MTTWKDLNDEFQGVLCTRGVCHRKSAILFSTWNADRRVLTGFELQASIRFVELEDKTANIVRQRFDGSNCRREGFDGDAQPQNILIIVNQFYFCIAVDVRTTEQDIALIALILWQGER